MREGISIAFRRPEIRIVELDRTSNARRPSSATNVASIGAHFAITFISHNLHRRILSHRRRCARSATKAQLREKREALRAGTGLIVAGERDRAGAGSRLESLETRTRDIGPGAERGEPSSKNCWAASVAARPRRGTRDIPRRVLSFRNTIDLWTLPPKRKYYTYRRRYREDWRFSKLRSRFVCEFSALSAYAPRDR